MRQGHAWLAALRPEFFGMGLLAAVTATFPLVLHPTRFLPASELAGVYSHVWKFWWTWQAVGELGVNPAFTTLLRHPEGLEVGRVMAGFGDAFWTMPITALLGPVASFNTVVFLNTAAGFWGAALLATRAGLGRGPAALAGLAWSLSPNHLGYLYGGAVEYLASPWTPLFLLALLELLGLRAPQDKTRRSWRWFAWMAAALAACLVAQAMTSWVKGLVLGGFGGLVMLGAVVAMPRRTVPGSAWAMAGLLAGGLVVLAATWWLFPAPSSAPTVDLHLASANVTRLQMTWKRFQPEEVALRSPEMWMNNHLLWTTGVLALLGATTRRGRIWLLLALPFVVDLLVPQDQTWRLGVQVPESLAPYLAAPARILIMAERRIFLLHLLLALSAAHGLSWVQRIVALRWPRASATLPFLAVLAWVAEWALLGPVRVPVPSFEARIQPHARYLAEAEPGAVIDLPLMAKPVDPAPFVNKATRSRYMFQQTVHGHPILTFVGSRIRYDYTALPQVDPVLETLHLRSRLGPPVPPRPIEWRPDALRTAGYRWVVLHPKSLSSGGPAARARLSTDLKVLLGEPRTFADGVELFRVPDSVERAASPGGP
ncbi:MAG: hypothetical protein JXB39_07130 [Deltaproteobacteria bacterium]|nr:hypothetical protein [Deltaproteobacteria bacterium]